jgi:hypothetical protein
MPTTLTPTEHITETVLDCGCVLSYVSDSLALSEWVVLLMLDVHVCSALLEESCP